MQPQLRRATQAYDLDITPKHAVRVAGAERLHRRLFGREAAREVNGRGMPVRAVRDLAAGEDPLEEAIAVSFDRRGDPVNIRGVEPESDDVRHAG